MNSSRATKREWRECDPRTDWDEPWQGCVPDVRCPGDLRLEALLRELYTDVVAKDREIHWTELRDLFLKVFREPLFEEPLSGLFERKRKAAALGALKIRSHIVTKTAWEEGSGVWRGVQRVAAAYLLTEMVADAAQRPIGGADSQSVGYEG